MTVESVESVDDPRLNIFRDLRSSNQAAEEGLFIAEGPNVVRRLFASNYDVHSIMLTDAKWKDLGEELPAGVPVYRVSNAVARELVGFRFHAGVLAAGVRASGPKLADVCGGARERLTLVIAVRVIDRQNVGALIRAGAAFGADAVVFGPQCSDPFSRRALRVSMGNGFFLPVCQVENLQDELSAIRDGAGLTLYATTLSEDAIPLPQLQSGNRCGFVFGNESFGLTDEWISFCDQSLTIPMAGGTDSLNVGFSAGIVLYEHLRDRL